jgi:tetratricopeptide (TPR) repeat protein
VPPPDPASHIAAAESALVGGDWRGAAVEFVAAADAYADLELLDAALDAAHQALRVAPDAPDVHLGLARLYFRRGWPERGADTLILLDRFLALDGDDFARAAVIESAERYATRDPRLAALAASDVGARRTDEPPG